MNVEKCRMNKKNLQKQNRKDYVEKEEMLKGKKKQWKNRGSRERKREK